MATQFFAEAHETPKRFRKSSPDVVGVFSTGRPEAPHFSERVALVPALLVTLLTAMHEVAEGQGTA
jgi:hypothetical protein